MKNINKADDNIKRLLFLNEKEIINCAVISSGCKLNQFESSQFEAVFKQLNINIVEPCLSAKNHDSNDNINLFLINTCTVTEKADAETDKIIRKIKKKYPDSRLILTGCSAQLNKIKFSEIPGVKLMDNFQKSEVLKISSQRFPDIVLNQKRTRPYLKIQEGCDLECSYCIIPKARPVKWSLGIKSILSSIEKFDGLGYKEVILTGINIGSYTDKNSGAKLKNLLTSIEELKNSVKIRLSSIDPVYIDDDMIKIFALSKKIQNHFHIPLQSASNKILKSMNRDYSFKDYKSLVGKITEKIKDASIGTDIISGFPGETEDDFSETACNLKKLPIYYIHAFSYSDRPGTESYSLKPKIEETEIKRRTGIIRKISSQKKIEFHLRFRNKTLEFLSLNNNKAISSNYIKAKITGSRNGNDGNGNAPVASGKMFKGTIIAPENGVGPTEEVTVIIESYI
ncbi:MAG: MiaB/RimO family radical SAM methylthiotransferase [bacterium]